MPHRLLIQLEIESESPFSSYLNPGEVVRGDQFRLNLAAINLGTVKFPGAKISNVSVEFRPYGQIQSQWTSSSKAACPEVEPGKRVAFFSDIASAIDEGGAWVHVKMEANDGTDIEYYQTPDDSLGTGEWKNCFYVTSRESIQIIALLDQISRRLK